VYLMLAHDVKQRQVRRLLAEGRIATYEKGELVVKLQEMEFAEEEALLAAENCEDIYAATKFLRQVSLLSELVFFFAAAE